MTSMGIFKLRHSLASRTGYRPPRFGETPNPLLFQDFKRRWVREVSSRQGCGAGPVRAATIKPTTPHRPTTTIATL
jgi:hypothetical protein